MQQLIKGENCLLELPSLLSKAGAREVLFVTGHHLPKDRLFQQLVEKLASPHLVVHPPEGVLQVDAIPGFRQLDAVVAIGGGKTMDYAKGIIHQHGQPVFFAAAPTTAGSGSEATPIAVFYRDREKVSLDAPNLLPQVAILDPCLLAALPAYQKAVSGADAVAQCIESIWNIHNNETSEVLAVEGLSLAWKQLPRFVKGYDCNTTADMLQAAYLAGKAISLTRTTGPHALSYFLTANYSVPHGQAVSLTLPLFFLYNEQGSRNQVEKICRVLNVNSSDDAFAACRKLFRNIGLATTLPELNLASISLNDWLASVNQQRFANNPVAFDQERLKELFQRYLF